MLYDRVKMGKNNFTKEQREELSTNPYIQKISVPMSKKVIFLDVDGTFINSSGVIPESARRAVGETRKNGNYVFLCTGRSTAGNYPWTELIKRCRFKPCWTI
jgi:hypothetical protein